MVCSQTTGELLLQGLAERLAEGLDITYGAVVTKVAWGPAGVAVTCADGARHTADAVVMTTSLAVLKATLYISHPL